MMACPARSLLSSLSGIPSSLHCKTAIKTACLCQLDEAHSGPPPGGICVSLGFHQQGDQVAPQFDLTLISLVANAKLCNDCHGELSFSISIGGGTSGGGM